MLEEKSKVNVNGELKLDWSENNDVLNAILKAVLKPVISGRD